MSPRRNWDSPTPSLASKCAPPSGTGGGDTRVQMRGWGSPNSNNWRKSLALCLFCVNNQYQMSNGPTNGFQGKTI